MLGSLQTLTVRDRILAHLSEFSLHQQDHQAPPQVSQKGIASAVGIHQKHIAQYVRPMITEGLVLERSSFIRGGRQHQKVYFLTQQGRTAIDWLRNNSRSREDFVGNAKIRSGIDSRTEIFGTNVERSPPSRSKYLLISGYRNR